MGGVVISASIRGIIAYGIVAEVVVLRATLAFGTQRTAHGVPPQRDMGSAAIRCLLIVLVQLQAAGSRSVLL